MPHCANENSKTTNHNSNNNKTIKSEKTTVVREITQTDKLNKLLLESVLKRLSKTGEIDKFVCENQDQEFCDTDTSDFQ